MDGWGWRVFRAKLRVELPEWEREGLITSEAREALAKRYSVGEPGADAAALAVYVLGALLVGGGVVSFVAWNWEALSDVAKLALVTSLMISVQTLGFWWWRIEGRHARLGHALVFLGTLIFAANVGLVAQVFHVSEHWYNGALAIGLGALAASLVHGSVPNTLVALVALSTYAAGRELSVPASALAMCAVFVPLAVHQRSRATYALIVPVAVGLLAAEVTHHTREGGIVTVVAILSTAMLLFAHRGSGVLDGLSGVSERWAAIGLLLVAFPASFREVAEDLSLTKIDTSPEMLLVPASLIVVAIGVWAYVLKARSLLLAPLLGSVACLLLLGAMAFRDSEVPVFIVANLVVFAFALGSIASSVHSLERRSFWFGMALGTILIGARFVEFEVGLLAKSAVFTGLGLAVIVLGVIFERRLKEARS
ncbi:MAG: DUF2157 domain-containing protein [Deltaproteobacteria bacterium]|nr:DUF2157 domain-containing protein [Deltaproteobacteria bacterium]